LHFIGQAFHRAGQAPVKSPSGSALQNFTDKASEG